MTNIKIILGAIATVLIVVFFFLWRNTVTELATAESALAAATAQVTTLTADNAKLVEYNVLRDAELKEIQNAYNDRLANIPADACGDTMPSAELLTYLKGETE